MDIRELINKGTFERSYRKCTTKAALNPAIAYAMNFLAGLDAKDRVLDPCCGSGILLIERQLLESCICVGVNIDRRAGCFSFYGASSSQAAIIKANKPLSNHRT